MTSFDRGRRRELQISFSLFAVMLSLSPTFAKAQQICQGNNKGSTDPNAVLYWTLTTHMNTPCISENVPPTNWINTGRHVVESAKHGRVGFASDPTHILYVPKQDLSEQIVSPSSLIDAFLQRANAYIASFRTR